MNSIFAYSNYKSFLRDLISSYPSGGRGVRKKLAGFIGCQEAHVTQVLSGHSHFSGEQGEAATRFFQLNSKEKEFLLLLIAGNRAATRPLQEYYEGLLEKKRVGAKRLKQRLAIPQSVPEYHQHTYYSSWHYAAIHMALLSPGLRTASKISEKLKIPLTRVNQVLQFLEEQRLASKEGVSYAPTEKNLHLDRSSPFISKHHGNWRLKAMQAMENEQSSDLHYSGVIICSRKDKAAITEKLRKCLEECVGIVRESPPEDLVVLNLDLFPLTTEN